MQTKWCDMLHDRLTNNSQPNQTEQNKTQAKTTKFNAYSNLTYKKKSYCGYLWNLKL